MHLTPRESTVLILLLRGRKHDVIASDLGISSRMVRWHLSNVRRKTGCNCGICLGFWAARNPSAFDRYSEGLL